MKIALTYPRISAGLAAGAIVGLFLSGVAYAVTSANFTYSAPQQGWITIHPMALAADADVRTYLIGYEPGTLNGSGCFQTGLNPPQGAKITSVDVWYSSQSEGDLQFRIYRHNLNTGAGGLVLVKNSTDTTGGRVQESYPFSAAVGTVREIFMYGFAVCAGTNVPAFYGARIHYTYTSAGD